MAAVVGLSSFAAALLGIEWTREAGNVASLWPANAIPFAVLFYRPRSAWVPCIAAFFLAVFLANSFHGDTLAVSLGLSVANVVEILAAVALCRAFAADSARLDNLPDMLRVLACAAVAAPLLGATVGAAVVHLAFGSPYWSVWSTWWAGDAVGMLVFLPICAVVATGKLAGLPAGVSRVEAVVTVLVYAVLTEVVFLEGTTYSLLLLLPALLWTAFRLGLVGTALAIAITGVTLTWLTVVGLGPIGEELNVPITEKIHDVHFILLTLTLPPLVIAITLEGRQLLSDALTESEERYRRLYDDSPVMLHSIGPDGRIVSVSQYWLDRMGYERSEVLGRRSTEFLTEESQRYANEEVLPRFFREGAIKDVEYQFVTKSGEVFDVLMSAIKLEDRAHHGTRSMAVIMDISDRKAAERRLDDVVEQLKSSNRDLEQFAYLASHDLQEPLRMVSSFTELLSSEYRETLDSKGKEYLHFAHDGAVRMSALIQDLLSYSRIGQEADLSAAVDLNQIVSAAVERLSAQIEETSAMIACSDLPCLRGNASMLTSLFQNLIGNALKYRGEEVPRIEVSAALDDGRWTVTVSDNGIGIDEKHHERIFGLFKRLHGRGAYEGTGIGLAMCQKIAERHGGRIWVDSELGRGSRFYIAFPCPPADALAA